MNRLLLAIAPGLGLALLMGVEPHTVLRYLGAVLSFGYARDMAICQGCKLDLLEL